MSTEPRAPETTEPAKVFDCARSSSSDDSQGDASVETVGLRLLLREKTDALEAMRKMVANNEMLEHCHRMSIAGLSKCISQQQQVIEQKQELLRQNAAAMAELTAKLDLCFAAMDANKRQAMGKGNNGKNATMMRRTKAAPTEEALYQGEDGHFYIDTADLDSD